MRRLVLSSVLLALLALPQAAGAAVNQIIHGAGYGHGVGMSQYGAYGYALHGWSYGGILAHYYRGTQLSRTGNQPIRVLLETGGRSAAFTGATSAGGHRLDPTKTYRVRLNGLSGEVLVDSKGKRIGSYDTPLDASSSSALVQLGGRALNGVSGGHYRGMLEFRPSPFSGLAVVNVVSLDDYVRGVVPGEMPSYWPLAALEAQAVAARSYAIATDAGGPVFDQYPDTRSQVYRGADGEQPSTNDAVDATAGQVVTYGGQVIPAYFFSTSGGRTEDVQNVFYGAQAEPYLVGVRDRYDYISPMHRWQITLSTRALQRKLGSLVRGRLRGIRVLQRGVSPRIVWALVVGTKGSVRVRGVTLRNVLGLRDTWASFSRFSTNQRRRSTTPPPAQNPTGGQPARQGDFVRVPTWAAELYGSVSPAPRRRRAVVQKLGRDHRWHTVAHIRLSRRGGYKVTVRGSGVFRIVAGSLAGPRVTVR